MRLSKFVVATALLLSPSAFAQEPDAKLLSYIETIRAVDNHAHVYAPDVANDTGYDALRCEVLPSTPDLLSPANLRFGPETIETWRALHHVDITTAEEADRRRTEVIAAEQKAHGEHYYDWVLDQAGFDTVFANRVAMTPVLLPPVTQRFRWVPYVDALLFPLINERLKSANPDRKALFDSEEQLFAKYLKDSGYTSRPATLNEYMEKVVRATLDRQAREGNAVAFKFEAAYLRSLDFGTPDAKSAANIYAKYQKGLAPSDDEYKIVQDYIFHEIAVEAGKLHRPVHIHTGSGCGEYFNVPGSDPLKLIQVFNDSSLRGTTFVMLHGGSPFERHNIALISRPNVYVDTSVMELTTSPQELARILRPWLEVMPEHILFGTDADFFGPGMGWQETSWLGSQHFRRALAIALTGMIHDHLIDDARAQEIATDVLRQNAWSLYKLGEKP